MGLKFIPFNENLILKLVRSTEKYGDEIKLMQILQNIQNSLNKNQIQIEEASKLLIEIALAFGRCGNIKKARDTFNFLIIKNPYDGNLFFEASQFEER